MNNSVAPGPSTFLGIFRARLQRRLEELVIARDQIDRKEGVNLEAIARVEEVESALVLFDDWAREVTGKLRCVPGCYGDHHVSDCPEWRF